MEKSAEKLPLDTRLLSNAVIELNISRRTVSLYPGNHGFVEKALKRAHTILEELFELRSEITLAVAKDTLIVDKYRLDTGNPVFRDFALSLSRMSVACLTFIKGLTIEELFSLQRFLTRDGAGLSAETLPEILKEYSLVHILVKPIDYLEFSFREGATDREGKDEYMVERYIKGILEGTLLPAEVAEVIDDLPPEVLAGLLSSADEHVIQEKTYDTVIAGYLRSTGGPAFSGKDLGKLLTFISKLRPELKRQFLSSSVRTFGNDVAALGAALDGVSVDKIIEFLRSLDENEIVIPEALRNILSQFSHLIEDIAPPEPAGLDNLADDIILSPEIMNILRGGKGGQIMTETYRAEMRNLIEADFTGVRESSESPATAEFGEDYIRYCYGQAILEIVSSAPGLSDRLEGFAYSEILSRLAEELIDAGQYGQIYEMITILGANIETGRYPAIARSVLEDCGSSEFIARLAASFRVHGRQARGAAMLLCGYYGERIVPSLFDLLTTEDNTATRKFLVGILARMGEKIVPESLRRMKDRRWFVRRNTLYILGESGLAATVPAIEPLGRDPDPRVRLEAAKCLVKSGRPEGVESLRALILKETGRIAEAAIVVAGTLKVRDVVPELVGLARKKVVRGEDYRNKIAVVRTLGQIGDGRAEAPLRELLDERSILSREQLSRLQKETRKALEILARETG